jgi:CheY-like chemotaxis protein
MDAATLARASEPFFTTKSVGQGTGLGLAMSKGFAEQSGGALRVESAPNKGTIVTIWLPETSPAKVRAAGAPLHGAGGLAPGQTCATKPVRVLLVDDQDGVRDVLAMNLEDAGYGVLAAASGAEALALLTAGETINAVVTDLTMPGMDGLALIRAVRDQHPCMPAVLVTGYTGEGVSVAVGESLGGTFALLRKPVQGVQLTDCLSMLLAGHSISS